MEKETGYVLTDKDQRVQIYEFKEIASPFPAHFYDYSVIGWMLEGTRNLVYNNKHPELVTQMLKITVIKFIKGLLNFHYLY